MTVFWFASGLYSGFSNGGSEIPKRQVDSTLSSTSVTVALWSIGTIINSRAFIILEFFVRLRNSSQIEYQN